MINLTDDFLKCESFLTDWIRSIFVNQVLSYQMPSGAEGVLTVHLYLLEITDDPLRRNTARPPIQPSLRYLLTTSGSSPRGAHELLIRLLDAALNTPNFEVEFEPAGSPVWSALQTPARPAFFLRVPLAREWPPVQGYRVESVLLGMHEQALLTLFGRVLGPGPDPDQLPPVAQAIVTVKGFGKSAQTDSEGCFSIPGLPSLHALPGANGSQIITISARGFARDFACEGMGTSDDPQPFYFDIPELPYVGKGAET